MVQPDMPDAPNTRVICKSMMFSSDRMRVKMLKKTG